jgi:hypothetical protein
VFHGILDALGQAKPTSDVLNEEDCAELAEYDAQIAEAWRIHNKYHGNTTGNPSNDSDSDSDLLVLASNLFNGIEGIETGGASDTINSSIEGIEIDVASEVKVSQYSRMLRKKAN